MDRDSDVPPEVESTKANPVMVDRIIKGVAIGLNGAIIPGETTQADLLSAVFTVLYRMLENSKRDEDPAEAESNAQEIGRVLTDMLFLFGGQRVH